MLQAKIAKYFSKTKNKDQSDDEGAAAVIEDPVAQAVELEDIPSTSTQQVTQQKRKQPPQEQRDSESETPAKKKKTQAGPREVTLKTVTNWQKQTGNEGQVLKAGEKRKPNLTWIRYEMIGPKVSKVWCYYCRRKPELLRSMNQKAGIAHDIDAYVVGTPNAKKTNVERHANSPAHKATRGMNLNYFFNPFSFSVF